MTAATLRTDTHCPYCALQCGMTVVTDGPAVSVEARQFPTNNGGLCQKGWTAAELLTNGERLTTPLMRTSKAAPLKPVSWTAALDATAAAMRTARERLGADAVGVFGGGGLTNEKAYLLGKFARVALRTRNIDYNGRFCMSSAAAANIRAFGLDRGLPFPLEDIRSTDAILLVGSNVAETMPPVMQHFAAQRKRGGALIVVDPRATPTAQAATLHLQPLPGTDLALANGLLHLAGLMGYVDHDFIAERTTGYDDVSRVVARYWPERVERITGVPEPKMREAVRLLGEASTAMVLSARGAEQHSKGTDTALALINLALALGQAGRPLSGYGCLTGQGNGQGGREHGQKADQLPGYRRIDDPAARAHVAAVWGVEPDDLPLAGPSAYELIEKLGGEIKALLVMGSNLVVSAPRAGHVEERLRSLDFLAVADVVLSETAAIADVVFPVTQWAEESGTTTNLEGRVLLRRQALPPPPDVRSDLAVIAGLASRLGHDFDDDPEVVFAELGRASAGGPADYSGISYGRIAAEDGVFWPAVSGDVQSRRRLFTDRFGTPDGRARFHPVEHRAMAEEVDADYPVYLTTGRVLAHYQSGAQTRRVAALRAAAPSPFVEMHPHLAELHAVADGDPVRLVTRRGAATFAARVTGTIRPDTVFVPFHWGGDQRANLLTNPALDPVSRMPEFKVCAVRLEPAS